MKNSCKTTVGFIDQAALAFTVGRDPELDRRLVAVDCIGTAAHVAMLSGLPVRPPIITPSEKKRIIAELSLIVRRSAGRGILITRRDQDVHMAVERILTARLGAAGKKIHTGRSRNDQVAVDLRLYAKERMFALAGEALALCAALLRLADRHRLTPMVGRTHMQPAMPSSVGLWAAAHTESLLDDLDLLRSAYLLNDRCPLGSAAGYGVPVPIDRRKTAALLGFAAPIQNVLYAGNARGKMESIVLCAASQVMATLSRLAQDLVIFTMPEFDYFSLPAGMCTGSSIMPQKKNPDILELVRAKAARVNAQAFGVMEIMRALPSGYNRDLQEIKEPFMEGLAATEQCARIMRPVVEGLQVNRQKLLAAFTPGVFAADEALRLVFEGVPFRDAYDRIKARLPELGLQAPAAALRRKRHLGAPANLGLGVLAGRMERARDYFAAREQGYRRAISSLLGARY